MAETILLIPDTHLRWQLADRLIKEVAATHVVFLGDFFDQPGDNGGQTRKAAVWLRQQLQLPNRTFLWGNHDISYAYPSRYTECSGQSRVKQLIIEEVLRPDDWKRFQWFCWVGDWLVTHAGLSDHFIPKDINPADHTNLTRWLNQECLVADKALARKATYWMFQAGQSRGGNQVVGGLNWLDFNDEFVPVAGLNQLVGHTCQHRTCTPAHYYAEGSDSYCIDTNSRHYGLFRGDKLEIIEVPDCCLELLTCYG